MATNTKIVYPDWLPIDIEKPAKAFIKRDPKSPLIKYLKLLLTHDEMKIISEELKPKLNDDEILFDYLFRLAELAHQANLYKPISQKKYKALYKSISESAMSISRNIKELNKYHAERPRWMNHPINLLSKSYRNSISEIGDPTRKRVLEEQLDRLSKVRKSPINYMIPSIKSTLETLSKLAKEEIQNGPSHKGLERDLGIKFPRKLSKPEKGKPGIRKKDNLKVFKPMIFIPGASERTREVFNRPLNKIVGIIAYVIFGLDEPIDPKNVEKLAKIRK